MKTWVMGWVAKPSAIREDRLEAKLESTKLVCWFGGPESPCSLGASGVKDYSGQAKVGRTVDALARTGEEGRDKLR